MILSLAWRSALSCLVVCVALGGCASTMEYPPARTAPVVRAPVAPELPPYRLQVGDVMDIKFALNPELNEQLVVRPDGRISTPFVQDLVVVNRSVSEVEKELVERYKSELKGPRLAIILRSFAPTRVYVAGEVVNPGEFESSGAAPTVLQAIARAGGLKPTALAERIVLMRRGTGDSPELLSVDLLAALQRGEAGADVRLAPYDVVWVPKTGVAEVYTAFNQYVQQFLPLSWSFVYQLRGSSAVIK